MTEKIPKFNNISLNKTKISKEPIDLFSVNLGQIVMSDKFKQ